MRIILAIFLLCGFSGAACAQWFSNKDSAYIRLHHIHFVAWEEKGGTYFVATMDKKGRITKVMDSIPDHPYESYGSDNRYEKNILYFDSLGMETGAIAFGWRDNFTKADSISVVSNMKFDRQKKLIAYTKKENNGTDPGEWTNYSVFKNDTVFHYEIDDAGILLKKMVVNKIDSTAKGITWEQWNYSNQGNDSLLLQSIFYRVYDRKWKGDHDFYLQPSELIFAGQAVSEEQIKKWPKRDENYFHPIRKGLKNGMPYDFCSWPEENLDWFIMCIPSNEYWTYDIRQYYHKKTTKLSYYTS